MNYLAILFGSNTPKAAGTMGRLQQALESELADRSETERDYIVGLAGLMSSVAHRDFIVTNEERKAMEELLQTHTELSPDLAKRVADMTLAHGAQLANIDDYKYIRVLKDLLNEQEKKLLVRILFSVAISNEGVSAEEEHHIGLIARDLRLSRTTFIDIRNEFAEFIALFK